MTVPRMEALRKRWEKIPPLTVSMAAIIAAFGGEAKAEGGETVEQDPTALIELLGGVGFQQGKPEWLQAQTTE